MITSREKQRDLQIEIRVFLSTVFKNLRPHERSKEPGDLAQRIGYLNQRLSEGLMVLDLVSLLQESLRLLKDGDGLYLGIDIDEGAFPFKETGVINGHLRILYLEQWINFLKGR